MGEFDGLKVKAEDNPFEGLKVRPEDLAPKSKYPGPKMVTDEEAGVNSGPERKLGVLEPGFPGTTIGPIGKVMRDFTDQRHAEALKAFASEVGGQVAGGALTAGVGAGVKPSTMATGVNALSSFAKDGGSGGFLKAFLNFQWKRLAGEEAAKKAAQNIGKVLPVAKSITEAAKAGVPNAAASAVGSATGAAATAASADPKPYRGAMSNAIDRLRVAAQTDARARELISRIDGTNNAGTGEVTQSTLGAQ